jgi:hypothetical protein
VENERFQTRSDFMANAQETLRYSTVQSSATAYNMVAATVKGTSPTPWRDIR